MITQAKCITRIKDIIRNTQEDINLKSFVIPLTNGKETPKLKTILEQDVDGKFYLRNDIVEKIVKEADFQERLVSFKVDKHV